MLRHCTVCLDGASSKVGAWALLVGLGQNVRPNPRGFFETLHEEHEALRFVSVGSSERLGSHEPVSGWTIPDHAILPSMQALRPSAGFYLQMCEHVRANHHAKSDADFPTLPCHSQRLA